MLICGFQRISLNLLLNGIYELICSQYFLNLFITAGSVVIVPCLISDVGDLSLLSFY